MICEHITNTPTLVLVLTFKALSLLSATHKTHDETFVTARSQQCRLQLLRPTCRHSSVAAKSRSRGSNEHDITNNNQITVYVNNCFCRNSASATNKRFWKGEFCTQISLRFPTLGLPHCFSSKGTISLRAEAFIDTAWAVGLSSHFCYHIFLKCN